MYRFIHVFEGATHLSMKQTKFVQHYHNIQMHYFISPHSGVGLPSTRPVRQARLQSSHYYWTMELMYMQWIM